MELSSVQMERYRRNIILPGVGVEGQKKLLEARVLVVGTGGLGSPIAYYLAAAGVGRLGLVDGDVVDLSNLQRQILHRTADLGRPKVVSAAEKLSSLNPDIEVVPFQDILREDNCEQIVRDFDVVVDGTDNFKTRFIINRVCVKLGKPFIFGGVLSFTGQVMTILPGRGPCLQCIFRKEPGKGAPSCAELGVLGAVPGVIGAIQATEVVKYVVGLGDLLVGRLLIYEALSMSFTEVSVSADKNCPVCGEGVKEGAGC